MICQKDKFGRIVPLLLAQTLGAFNDNAVKAFLPVLAAFYFGKESMDQINQWASLLLILPFILFAPLAGWVSDRFSKRRVIGVSLFSQLLALAVILLGISFQSLLCALIGFFLLSTQKGRKNITGYTTDIITDRTLNWLKNERDKEKPFFLCSWHKAPHRNWLPAPKYMSKYNDRDIPEPETLRDAYRNRLSPASSQTMTIDKHMKDDWDFKLTPPRELNEEQKKIWNAAYEPKNQAFHEAKLEGDDLLRWKYQRYAKDYLRCIDSVDENIGRLLDYLDQGGLAENTLVIYSSDQGWYLGEHGWYDKRWMYEESFRTPLLVRWPGTIRPGSVNMDLVQNLDYAQTFLDICGAKQPVDMQGKSLLPLLKGETPEDWRESIYYHYYEFPGYHNVRRHYGVRNHRYKLIHFYMIDGWELYDLQNDPNELNSVYGKPAYAKVTEEMKKELSRLRKEYQVPEDKRPLPKKIRKLY